MRPPSVEDQVEQFAQRIENLLASVVLVSEEDYVFTAAPEGTYARVGNSRCSNRCHPRTLSFIL